MAKMKGSGWHGQTLRHSRARRIGSAGGKYSATVSKLDKARANIQYQRQKLITESLEHKNLSVKDQSRIISYFGAKDGKAIIIDHGKGILSMKDTDKDGVPDKYDCKPENPLMQGTNAEVAEAYAEGRTDKSGTMFIEDNTVYSYGHHFPIAHKIGENTYLVNKDKYSVTTSRHQNLVKAELKNKGAKIIPLNTENLKRAVDAEKYDS